MEFEEEVLRKRPYLQKAGCIRVARAPVRKEPREQNLWCFWAPVRHRPRLRRRNLAGIDIDNASHKVVLQRLVGSGLPGELERIAG